MRWAGYVVCMGEMENELKKWLKKPKENDHLEAKVREDNIKMVLKKTGCDNMNGFWLDHARVPVSGSCERGNEPLGSMKGGELFYQQSFIELIRSFS